MRLNLTPEMARRDASSDCAADAEEWVLMLAERTGPDAPASVRHALAVLAASLGHPAAGVIRSGLLGYDAEGGPVPDVIAWT